MIYHKINPTLIKMTLSTTALDTECCYA